MNMNQKKKAENLSIIYQEMDEERRHKMEHIAEGLLNVQMLVDEEKNLLFCVLLTLYVYSFAQENRSVSLNEAIQGSITYLTGRLNPGTKLVVLNFNAPTKSLSDYIIDDLNDYIVNSGNFTVVDRRNLDTLQQELKFQMSGDVSDETAQAIGKMLGAQTIISGSITPLGRNYRFRVQATEVETAAIQGGQTVSVTEDATLAALLGDKDKSIIVTNQKFAIGVQAGALWGIGTDFSISVDDERSIGFLPSVYGAYAFNNYFRVQAGINLALNNGYSGDNYFDLKYTSLDIPLIPYLLFNPISNILLRVGAGPYVSIPLTDIEYEYRNEKYPITNTFIIGIIGGFGAGYRIGKGNLFLDVRYQLDLSPTSWERNGREEEVLTRRGLSGVFGYEYWF
jgi:hypothetical protein